VAHNGKGFRTSLREQFGEGLRYCRQPMPCQCRMLYRKRSEKRYSLPHKDHQILLVPSFTSKQTVKAYLQICNCS
jgi:hypothetical protein